MNIVIVFLLIVILLLVILFLLDKSGKFDQPEPLNSKTAAQTKTYQQRQANVAGNTFLPTPVWSQPQPYNVNTTGQCLAYTFLGNQYLPAEPSYAILNGSGGRGIINTSSYLGVTGPVQGCIDTDQLFAATIQHECINQNGTSAGAGCILTVATNVDTGSGTQLLLPGERAPQGTIEGNPQITGVGSEVLYSPCFPSNLSGTPPGSAGVYCAGSLGLLIPNFIPQANSDPGITGVANNCMYASTTDPNFTKEGYYETYVKPCDLTDQSQMFRMVRYSLDSSYNLNLDNNGNLASIIHRATGFYVAPSVYFQENPSISLNEKAQLIGSNPSGVEVVVNDQYNFEELNIVDQQVTDINGETYPDYVDVILINPAYDTTRNGVYWLLQNQTINPQINPNLTNIKNFLGQGVYPTQSDFTKHYPQALPAPLQSYPFTQIFQPGVAGLTGPPLYPTSGLGPQPPNGLPLNIPNNYMLNPNGDQSSLPDNTYIVCSQPVSSATEPNCWFGVTFTSPSTNVYNIKPGVVENVPMATSPQQIVYVPDLYLLPTITTDPVRLWTYLINSYSLNLRQTDNKPILTPYRQQTKIDVVIGMEPDTSDPNCLNNGNSSTGSSNFWCENWFFTMQGYVNSGSYYADSQFIDYSQYVQQIQMPVAVGGKGGNGNYASKANPIVPAAAPTSTISKTSS